MNTEEIKKKVQEWLELKEPKDITEFLKNFSKEKRDIFYQVLYYVQKNL